MPISRVRHSDRLSAFFRTVLGVNSDKPADNPGIWQHLDSSLAAQMTIYLAAVAWMWWAIHARTGEISYTVDDAYIHCTIARNLVLHGTFGIIPGEFAGASSSLLWTYLLAFTFLMSGIHAWLPALLATLFGALAIERSNLMLKRIGIGPWLRIAMVLMAMAYAPLLPIVSTGMEHTFHAWSVMGLFALLVGDAKGRAANPWAMLIWGALAAGGRYESLFLLPSLLIWLALRKKWIHAAALTTGMFLPVIAFAA